MKTVLLATEAMRCRFELVLEGDSEERLVAAGEEALAEIEAVERQLSAYDPESELWAVNALAGKGPVRVRPTTLAFLEEARALTEQTAGAFDPTIGALIALWRGSEEPTDESVAQALARTGWQGVLLDHETNSITLAREGLRLDPGAIGKGWALDRARDILEEAGVTRALLHGGTSSVVALGEGWKVQIGGGPTLTLSNQSLGVSAPSGRWAVFGERRYGHVLDPRTGWPVGARAWAAVIAPTATQADALSTALLVRGEGAWPGCHTFLPEDVTLGNTGEMK
ncbi:FAD:protein FMN transferase [Armatimonas rosea]|uniref:FAD:protein FMN transferase n=1 Tax=Armatimonas rosea TaxID=685828 RepID=A0A7W9W5T6_ARMRO|nr:FAD:protein FMN transferase [Armatimonas rosea]MBB6049260.1 thiamine biosynthesis lipoprotein [Armatimonas rosea]